MKYIILSLIIIFTTSAMAGEYSYEPSANPDQLLVNSFKKAKEEDKLVLVVFGSDWCPDCRSLNTKFNQKPLAETISSNFVVMHVDVGEWDKNIPFTEKFGKPIDGGIPSIAILGSDRNLFYVAEGGEFASARTSKVKSLNDWFASVASEIAKMTSARAASEKAPSSHAAGATD